MTKWEYKTVTVNTYLSYGFNLNDYGEEGWELVAIQEAFGGGNYYTFKRPIPEVLNEDNLSTMKLGDELKTFTYSGQVSANQVILTEMSHPGKGFDYIDGLGNRWERVKDKQSTKIPRIT